MPSDPLIIPLLDDAVKALELMSKARGYHLDYQGVRLSAWTWDAEQFHGNPIVQVFLRPSEEEGLGAERAYNRFRHEDELHAMVHLKAGADWDVVRPMCRVRADLHKALLADRNRGQLLGKPNTFHVDTDFEYYNADGKERIGGTVDARFKIRWEHDTGNMASDST